MKKMKVSLLCMLAGTLLFVGCQKQNEEGKRGATKLTWSIAGVWEYDTDEAIEGAQDVVNEVLQEKGKDYRIEFQILPMEKGKLSEEDEKRLKESDLITMANQISTHGKVEFASNVSEYAKSGAFEALDEWLESKDGERIKEVFIDDITLEAGRLGGKQWMLPTSLQSVMGSSLKLEESLYQKLGVESVPDFTKCDELFAKIYEINDNQPFLTLSAFEKQGGVNGISVVLPEYLEEIFSYSGSVFQHDSLGVGSWKAEGSSLDTRNLFETGYVTEVLCAWNRYREKGYVNAKMDTIPLVRICDSYVPEVFYMSNEEQRWVVPKSENYVLNMTDDLDGLLPFFGMGSESEQKEAAFTAMADFIAERELNEAIQEIGQGEASRFVFYPELSEEGKMQYRQLLETAPRFRMEPSFDTFEIPEIERINQVYAKYAVKEDESAEMDVMQQYFSKDGVVSEESIREQVQVWNEKLKNAGMDTLIEQISANKK